MSKELITHLDSRGVLTVTMDRPDVHNAFDELQIERLSDVLEKASTNAEVNIVVLGAAGKHFCAGADINYMQRMGEHSRDENLADAAALARLMQLLNTMPKPTIARVQGAAYGGAVGLICCSDFAIGASSAVLSMSEVRIGLVPATISPYVIRAVGQRAARRLFISGERIAASAAQSLGLLHSVVEDEQLDDAIEGVVDALLENSPNAMAMAKQLVFAMTDDVSQEMIDHSVQVIANIRESEEGKEGVTAFLEKRSPNWVTQHQ